MLFKRHKEGAMKEGDLVIAKGENSGIGLILKLAGHGFRKWKVKVRFSDGDRWLPDWKLRKVTYEGV